MRKESEGNFAWRGSGSFFVTRVLPRFEGLIISAQALLPVFAGFLCALTPIRRRFV